MKKDASDELRYSIESGNSYRAETLLSEISPESINRYERLALSKTANIKNCHFTAITLLNPQVIENDLSERELFQYSYALRALGASEQAVDYLNTIEVSRTSVLSLQKAKCYIDIKDYEKATHLIESYICSCDLTMEDSQFIKILLSACYICMGDYSRAEILLSRLLSDKSLKRKTRLHSQACDLRAKMNIIMNLPKEALRVYEKDNPKSNSQWRALAALQENPYSSRNQLTVKGMRLKSLRNRDWELHRDITRYEAHINKSATELLKVYFGTPFQGYKQSIKLEASHFLRFPKCIVYDCFNNDHTDQIIDLTVGEIKRGNSSLYLDGDHLRLVRQLAKDFYKPLTTTSLAYKLFPEKIFHPSTALRQINDLVNSTNRYLSRIESGLLIEMVRNQVHLNYSRGTGVILYDFENFATDIKV